MATKVRNPTGDGAFSGTWTGSVGTRYTAVDDYPDSGNPIADGLTHGTSAGVGYFTFPAFDLPSGSTGISVQVLYYDYKTSSQSTAWGGTLRCNDTTDRAAATHNPGNGNANIAARSDNWANNPKSGAAWTVNDVNGVGTNGLTSFGLKATDASPTLVVSSIQLQVTFTAPTIGTTIPGSGSITAIMRGLRTWTVAAVASISTASLKGSGALAATISVASTCFGPLNFSSRTFDTAAFDSRAFAGLIGPGPRQIEATINVISTVTLPLVGKTSLHVTAPVSVTTTAGLKGAGTLSVTIAAVWTISNQTVLEFYLHSETNASANVIATLQGAGALTSTIPVLCSILASKCFDQNAFDTAAFASAGGTVRLFGRTSLASTISAASDLAASITGAGVSSISATIPLSATLSPIIKAAGELASTIAIIFGTSHTLKASGTLACVIDTGMLGEGYGESYGEAGFFGELLGTGILAASIPAQFGSTIGLSGIGSNALNATIALTTSIQPTLKGKTSLATTATASSAATLGLVGHTHLSAVMAATSSAAVIAGAVAPLQATMQASIAVNARIRNLATFFVTADHAYITFTILCDTPYGNTKIETGLPFTEPASEWNNTMVELLTAINAGLPGGDLFQ